MKLTILASSALLMALCTGCWADRAQVKRLLQTKQCQGCSLAGANLTGAMLGGANLRGSNLSHAHLNGSNLFSAAPVGIGHWASSYWVNYQLFSHP